MKLDKLARQLRRDLLASPKKAAALGLMFLVALYFWAPLVKKWLVPGTKKPVAAAPAEVAVESSTPAAAPQAAGTAFPWERVRDLVSRDQRMTSALLAVEALDPFRGVDPHQEKPTEEPTAHAETQSPPPEVDPAQAGLVLTSIAVGPQRSVVLINGIAYREGAIIAIPAKEKDDMPIEFRLARIDRAGADLERGGKTWRLELQNKELAQGDKVTRGSQN